MVTRVIGECDNSQRLEIVIPIQEVKKITVSVN